MCIGGSLKSGPDRGLGRLDVKECETVLPFEASDTIEGAIVESLERKDQLARGIVGDKGAGPDIAEMSPDEFIHLVTTGALPRMEER